MLPQAFFYLSKLNDDEAFSNEIRESNRFTLKGRLFRSDFAVNHRFIFLANEPWPLSCSLKYPSDLLTGFLER